MGKLIMASVIAATVVVPLVAAGDRDVRRGLKRTVLVLFAFNVVYLALLALVYARFFPPEVR
jgi:hypothetical protein